MTTVAEWVAFLNARLDEDEAVANGLLFACRRVGWTPDFTGTGGPAAEAFWRHYDPHRMLREVAAKRAIIAEVLHYEARIDGEWACCHSAEEIAAGKCDVVNRVGIPEFRHMGAIWSGHPDHPEG